MHGDKMKPGQIDITVKEIVFAVQCIKIVYPDLFLALMVCPYFKEWNTMFAKQFHNLKSQKSMFMRKL